MRQRLCVVVATLGLLALNALPVAAQDSEAAASPAFRFRTSIKGSALAFRLPDAPDLFPQRTGGESVWRIRVEPEMRSGANAVFTLAYEQRLRYTSARAGIATMAILPSEAMAPFRIRPLDWTLSQSSTASWRHEIDRANVQLHVRRADITIGRQAIGWGRGVMFGAVDLFAPFSPLEADREWRRGVDAVRTDVKLSDRSSIDLIGAFGTTLDSSAFAARVRGYAALLDVEAMAGRRARDLFGGVTTSAAVGDAELHGELALFHLPADVVEGDPRTVWKAVAGGSYRFPLGSGILVYAEYHYSGFGAAGPEEILALMSSPTFVERYVRGDTQILSRHAVAVSASYEASPEVVYSGQWLHNPRDHSGIAAPGFTYTISDALSLLATAYVPYGNTPRAGVLRSEFGSVPISGLLQLRLYF